MVSKEGLYKQIADCMFVLAFKSFKTTAVYVPMLTSHGCRLYTTEPFSAQLNALLHCYSTTLHFPKISDCVTQERSSIFTI